MNSNIQTLTTIWCVLIFLGLSGNLYAQTTDALFNVVSNADAVLSASELHRYTNLDNDKIKEKALIDITGLEQALQSSEFSVPFKGTNHSLRSTNFSNAKEGSFTFKGTFTEALGEVYLYQTEGYLYGNIHIDSLAYQIEPINKKYAILLRRDYSEDVCPLGEEHSEKEDSGENKQNDSSKSKSALMSNPVIDVMIVYSNQAAAAVNMQAHAQGSIQSSNDTFSNSDTGVRFNLVHYQQVSYSESGSVQTDHGRLLGISDGYMDNIHSLRDQYGADVVVLIVSNDPSYCGTAGNIGVGSSQAFAVTRDDCSIGNYTFAHEIGHLAGARHDNDGSSSPYAYGHGFKYTPAYWRTVMATNAGTISTNRIPYWSNPDKYYGGIAMGTTSWRDNARVWDVRASTLAGFKTVAPPPFISNFTGPLLAETGQLLTWTAASSGGSTPYTYLWEKQASGSSTWSYLGTGSSVQLSLSTPQYFNLRLKTTDATSAVAYGTKQIIINNSSGGGCSDPTLPCKPISTHLPDAFTLDQNYPNPFNPTTTISFTLPEEANVTIKVYSMMGQLVATLADGTISAGQHEAVFEAGNLSSGLYIAQINAVGFSGATFTKEMKMQLIK